MYNYEGVKTEELKTLATGEIAHHEKFLLLPQYFPKSSTFDKGLKQLLDNY